MKRLSFSKVYVSIILVVYFSGCLIFQQRPDPRAPVEVTRQEEIFFWEILDYRNSASGESIPQWLDYFLDGGIAAVEQLEEFENYYVFVSMNSGNNLNALEQWNTGFSPDLDFPRLAAVRIENRFLHDARSYPDNEYGSYFLALIRSASDALWQGAVRDGDFWLLRRFYDADGVVLNWESYNYFILVKVERDVLTPQITTLLRDVRPEEPLSTDQQRAVNRVVEQFFENF